MGYITSLWSKWFDTSVESSVLSVVGRDKALDLLEKNGLRAHYYLPAVGMESQELANACRTLASAGYIITAADGTITGKVASARPTKKELAALRRAAFKLVQAN
ncbi:hypothetical protein [Methylotenera sp.]|uniref:hypothetical protein n=1 Tax=Methylotenera sp. TaxID=2051956 RepID=UPI002ED7D32E